MAIPRIDPPRPVRPPSPAVLMVCLLVLVLMGPDASGGWTEDLEWGGHIRLRGAAGDPEPGSRLEAFGGERLYDRAFELRSKHGLDLPDAWELELHYEMVGTQGDTLQADNHFLRRYPQAEGFLFPDRVSDERRLMDLSADISEGRDDRLYHRLDRLALTTQREWGTLRVGRQALTWGNGFLFHPMDLFNPFSPTDVERDYKIGDDMAWLQAYTGATGDLQMLYVPRRDPETGDVEWDQSSLAAKHHRYAGDLELDLMAGIHYRDIVTGLGLIGSIGGAAWRVDTTYTRLDHGDERNGFASVCANLDYSWVAWGRNMYGWIEYYYTGLGTSDYEEAWTDEDLVRRIQRGERFTLGRSYVDTSLRIELHPLLNFQTTLIANTQDPSGAIQPRMVWDARQDLQITAGANTYWGGQDTEFGGIPLPGLPFDEAPADSVYLWASYFF